MRRFVLGVCLAAGACATAQPPPPAPPAPLALVPALPPEVTLASDATCAVPTSSTASTAIALVDSATVPAELAEIDDDASESEARSATTTAGLPRVRYTQDLSDEALEALWKTKPEALGAISIGFADEGRIINAVPFPCDGGDVWTVVQPATTWATTETIDYVIAAAERVKQLHPTALPLRVNSISAQEGGYLRPHKSHQSGRDVDLGFYYDTPTPSRTRARETIMHVAQNWELLKSLVITGDVQIILIDRRVQKVLYDHALSIGEDKAWLDSLFFAGKGALVQHARGHRDHFHVRYYNPRAQELGRRIQPFLAQRPEQNLVTHRVRSGDTLGAIARKYGSGVKPIQRANRMRGTFLRLGQVLRIPVRGPCTQCPVPPPVDVPPRRLPPEPRIAEVVTSTGTVSSLAEPAPVLLGLAR